MAGDHILPYMTTFGSLFLTAFECDIASNKLNFETEAFFCIL